MKPQKEHRKSALMRRSKEELADKAYYELACEVEKLRTENANLHASCMKFERKCASLIDDNERLTAELKKRPPRLVITKLQKGNNDENSEDTVTLQECEADNYI